MAGIGIDDTQNLRDFGKYMKGTQVDDMQTVADYAKNEGCNKAGFTGLFEVLKGSMDLLSGAVDELNQMAKSRLESSGNGLNSAADEYDRIEQGATNTLDDMHRG